MRHKSIISICFVLLTFSLFAQNMADYTGNWEGKIVSSKIFGFTVTIENLQSSTAVLKISNNKIIIQRPFKIDTEKFIEIPMSDNLSFIGDLSEDGKEINGFIKSGLLLYHIKLTKAKTNSFQQFRKKKKPLQSL